MEDIKEKSLIELKAMAFDNIKTIDICRANLELINKLIAEKEKRGNDG